MNFSKTLLFWLLTATGVWFSACTTTETAGQSTDLPSSDADNGLIELPLGFGAAVIADDLGRVRHMAVRDNGDVYVKLRKANETGNTILALRDTDGDGRLDQRTGWADYSGTGLEVYNNHIYAASDTSIHRYALSEGELLPASEKGEVIVSGFPKQGSHASKTFAFDQQGKMYVNVGAPSNACQEEARTQGSGGQNPCHQLELQAGIWQFDADRPGQTQVDDGLRYATGIRNAVAITWNENVNSLFVLQHGRDQLSGLWPDLYTDEQSAELPSEEFLQVSKGDDFGWPYCYFDHFQDKKLLAPEYGGDGTTQGRCEGIKAPIEAFPAHMAPNDVMFYTGDQFPEKYQNGAFIAFHGSWNRAPQPQEGYYVVFLPIANGVPSGEWEVFANGFSQLKEVASPGDAVYRPCGLAMGPDGSLYISDSVKGRIWRVMYYGDDNLAQAE
ncbi:MAG: PQQ-dependent sugar dehydrogenase [Bacteroidota bacterium]